MNIYFSVQLGETTRIESFGTGHGEDRQIHLCQLLCAGEFLQSPWQPWNGYRLLPEGSAAQQGQPLGLDPSRA